MEIADGENLRRVMIVGEGPGPVEVRLARVGEPPIAALNRQGLPLPDQVPALAALDGVILLDGSWSQAKALWWRNAWLLKTRRLVLNPGGPSRYGRLRKEPRPDSVSTLEAAAFAMAPNFSVQSRPFRVLSETRPSSMRNWTR